MALAAGMMKSLLVVHDRRFGVVFQLDLRNFRQQLGRLARARVAVGAFSDHRARILFQKIQRQSSRTVGRPGGLVRWTLGRLAGWLRRVMTIHTGSRPGEIGTAILGKVLQMIERDLAQFCFLCQHNRFRRLFPLR